MTSQPTVFYSVTSPGVSLSYCSCHRRSLLGVGNFKRNPFMIGMKIRMAILSENGNKTNTHSIITTNNINNVKNACTGAKTMVIIEYIFDVHSTIKTGDERDNQ